MRRRQWMPYVVVFALLVTVSPAAAQSCRITHANIENNGEPFTISTTAVMVLKANTSRCSALIFNNSPNGLICRDRADGVPTATAGTLIPGGQSLTMGLESQGQWQCIRAGAADVIAYVTEGRT